MFEDPQATSTLPRCGEWIGALVTFPSYVTGEGAPYKPTAVMWLEPETGCVVDSQLVRPEEALPRAAGFFHLATREPLAGKPRRPARVRVSDEALAHALRGSLGEVELVVAPTPEVDDVIASMTAHIEARDREDAEHVTYLGDGVEPGDVAHLFRAAARLYRAQPWRSIPADAFVSMSCERIGVADGAVSVVGQMGQSFGFAVFRSVEDATSFIEAAHTGERDKIPPQLMFNFDDRRELPEGLVREIAQHGWEVAGPRAYPWLAVIDDELISRPPTLDEYVGATAIASALAELVERTPRLEEAWETGDRVGWSGSIATARGDVEIRLWAPLWLGGDEIGALAKEDAATWQSVVDEDGVVDLDLFEDHFDAFLARFENAPESSDEMLPIAEMLVEYSAMQFGVTIVGLTPREMEQLLFKLIPKKVTIEAEAAPLIIATMRALLELARRELGSETAGACLAALAPTAAERLARELADERNFGMAKSLFVQGARAGYDMTSEAGIAAFVDAVNRGGRGSKTTKTSSAKTKAKAKAKAKAKTNTKPAPPRTKAAKPRAGKKR